MQLEAGQVAVVTGAASGIGAALCDSFAQRGVSIVLSDIDEASLLDREARIQELGVETLSVVTDVTEQSAVDELAARTFERFGRVDVLANNAGTIGKCLPVWEFEKVEWEWILAVDLWGVIHGIRAFVPHMVERGHGHVVNTASMAGLSIVSQLAPYAAAKHAVVSISETLWTDLQEKAPGVGVTVICPGPTLTRLMTEGERYRPAHLVPSVDAGIAPQLNPATFAASASSMFQPEQVAEAVVEAMARDLLYLAPNPGSLERIDRRVERIRSEVGALQIVPGAEINSKVAFQGASNDS
jgi:NAD(P)-dependent dehydrogenase (short-subunit alcohol dehydrogenase family)